MQKKNHLICHSKRKSSGFTIIELLVVVVCIAILVGLLLPAVQQAREAARRTQCQNNLTQIGLALNNYQMAHEVLPPGTIDDIGPIISKEAAGYHMGWMTQILPHLEEQTVFRHVDFTKSVYDPVNAPARQRRIRNFLCPSDAHSNTSTIPGVASNYCGVHNDYETPIDENQNGVLFLNSSIGPDDVRDGNSHTIFVMETQIGVSSPLGWMTGTRATLRNAVIRVSEDSAQSGRTNAVVNPVSSLEETVNIRKDKASFEASSVYQSHMRPVTFLYNGSKEELDAIAADPDYVGGGSSFHTGGMNILMGDGAVRYLSDTIDANVLRRLAHRADGGMNLADF